MPHSIDGVLAQVDAAADEIVAFTSELIRIPTINPPGERYDDCARLIGRQLQACGFQTEYFPAEGRPEHTSTHPRINVVGTRRGSSARPTVHLNGHLDVVPAGDGWTIDPFGGIVRDGRVYGRGSCDMKAGIAAALYAAEAIRRADARPAGTIEISGTVDEESGGFAGVAWLAEQGRISSTRTDYVIIPEPLGVDRVCVGHRGVYWFEVITHGRIAHGSMPYLGINAVERMATFIETVRTELEPALATRVTAMPVVPEGSRRATININAIEGGQVGQVIQTPCVADRCRAIFDRRFLIEEGFDATRAEIAALLEHTAARIPEFRYELNDLMVVHPVRTPENSPVVSATRRAIQTVLGREAAIVASPGTYDHKHVTRIGGITDCIAYGPGVLELAHQPDEWCGIDDLINATKVLALAILELTGGAEDGDGGS